MKVTIRAICRRYGITADELRRLLNDYDVQQQRLLLAALPCRRELLDMKPQKRRKPIRHFKESMYEAILAKIQPTH